jgi:hypothetical protein
MREVWGKPARWVNYSGEIEGEKLAIAIFDHPSSFRHPVRWHSRDYGLVSANPFGSRAFDKEAPPSEVTLEPGQTAHLKYRVVIHPALEAAAIEDLYKKWAATR